MAFKPFAAYQWRTEKAKKGSVGNGEKPGKWGKRIYGGDCSNNIKNNSTVGSSWQADVWHVCDAIVY